MFKWNLINSYSDLFPSLNPTFTLSNIILTQFTSISGNYYILNCIFSVITSSMGGAMYVSGSNINLGIEQTTFSHCQSTNGQNGVGWGVQFGLMDSIMVEFI